MSQASGIEEATVIDGTVYSVRQVGRYTVLAEQLTQERIAALVRAAVPAISALLASEGRRRRVDAGAEERAAEMLTGERTAPCDVVRQSAASGHV